MEHGSRGQESRLHPTGVCMTVFTEMPRIADISWRWDRYKGQYVPQLLISIPGPPFWRHIREQSTPSALHFRADQHSHKSIETQMPSCEI